MSSAYFADIERFPLLTRDEERELARRVAEGDHAARNRMAEANLRLVISIARKFQHRGIALDDLICEGNCGLLRAVELFDPGRNTRFSTYASHWVRSYIQRALAGESTLIRLPVYMGEILHAVRVDPAHQKKLTVKQRKNLALARLAAGCGPVLFSEIAGGGEADDRTDHAPGTVDRLLDVLTAIERDVVIRRYGLLGQPRIPRGDVARDLKTNPKHVGEIELRARRKMGSLATAEDRERWGNDHVS